MKQEWQQCIFIVNISDLRIWFVDKFYTRLGIVDILNSIADMPCRNEEKIMKRVIAVFVLALCFILLCSFISGCDNTTNDESTLSAAKEKKIKKAYVELYNETFSDNPKRSAISFEDVEVRHYGTYNGATFVIIYPNIGEGSDNCSVGYIHIDGYYLETAYGNTLLHIYKNGKLTEVVEAYEKGIISKDDVAYMAKGIVAWDGTRIPYSVLNSASPNG